MRGWRDELLHNVLALLSPVERNGQFVSKTPLQAADVPQWTIRRIRHNHLERLGGRPLP